MARKGENIRKRKDGRWEARYVKARNPDGSIKYGYVYAKKYAEVKAKRNEMLRLLGNTVDLGHDMTSNTFNELFDEWKINVRHNIKESSYFFYDTLLEHHIRPYFGNFPIEQLTSSILQDFINMKIDEQLSISYIHSIMILFHNIFKFAQSKYSQPLLMPAIQLPKLTKKSIEIFTLNEWRTLVAQLKSQNDPFSFGILLCMYTGIRIGELSGLQWGDYDSLNVQFKIRRTVYRIKNADYIPGSNLPKTVLCIESPKTPSSIRDIPLPYGLANELQQRKKSAKTFVLTGTEQCMEPRNIQKRYKNFLKRIELRYLNFHSLRHSFATLSIQSGSDYKTVSELLGHTSVNTTLNIYVHSSIEQKRQCLEMLIE